MHAQKKTIATKGVDSTRLHILYKAPPSEVLEWDDASIVGMQRWLGKVWRIVTAVAERTDGMLMRQAQEREFDVAMMNKEERELWKAANLAVKDVS